MFDRVYLERLEEGLNPYACRSSSPNSSKRSYTIESHPYRTGFQRDRDRILHSKAFRRLEYKTQVFMTQISDHLRTRLTHSLEVSQLSRTVALILGLNCDLVEAIALGHDVGHTPFGHAGEKQLIRILESRGIKTFKHNSQSVRILELLEKKYYDYEGLSLTLPVREGILKHTSLPEDIPEYCKELFPEKRHSITLEGQIVAVADEIAQQTHDIDDYLRYDIIEYKDLVSHNIFKEVQNFYLNERNEDISFLLKSDGEQNYKDSVIRCLVDFLVTLLIKDSEKKLEGTTTEIIPFELNEIYINFNDEHNEIVQKFKEYKDEIMSNNYKIKEMDKRGSCIIDTLFNYYLDNPQYLEDSTLDKYKKSTGIDQVLVIVDFISGMTDRFAIQNYNKIVDIHPKKSVNL